MYWNPATCILVFFALYAGYTFCISEMPRYPQDSTPMQRILYEFNPTLNHIHLYRRAYTIGSIVFILLTSIIMYIRTDADLENIHLLIAGAIIHLLRIVGVISLPYIWIAARIIGQSILDCLSQRWVEKKLIKIPNESSFGVPYYRFLLPAASLHIAINVSWLLFLYVLLYVVPDMHSSLPGFIPKGLMGTGYGTYYDD
jgi:hypothetical protein